MVPFVWAGNGLGYSLLLPTESSFIASNTPVTRDYVEGQTTDPLTRQALLCPWVQTDLTHLTTEQVEPGTEFWQSARQAESLPDKTAYRETYYGVL